MPRTGFIDHVGIGVPDLAATKQYYDELLSVLGLREWFDTGPDGPLNYGPDGAQGSQLFFYRAEEAGDYSRSRTGLHHLAFLVETRAVVRAAHEWARARDAVVLDEPGEFPQYGAHCYATYWLDPHGIKLEAVCHVPEEGVAVGEMRERMLRGELYIAEDPEIAADFARAQKLVERYNRTLHEQQAERDELLRELIGELGEGVVIRPPFFCEYGTRVSIGARTFVNYDCLLLDVAPITIGSACQLATRVQLLTATHPIDPEPRRAGWESAEPIAIGDNVWLGGGAIVLPGVTIGEDTVVGAGAVVTRDLPAGVVAAGVPARVLREIGDADRVDVPQA